MREQPDFLAELRELFTDDSIQESFFRQGGIIRHVLPYYPTYHKIIDAGRPQSWPWIRKGTSFIYHGISVILSQSMWLRRRISIEFRMM